VNALLQMLEDVNERMKSGHYPQNPSVEGIYGGAAQTMLKMISFTTIAATE
jgi:hypothetical protein